MTLLIDYHRTFVYSGQTWFRTLYRHIVLLKDRYVDVCLCVNLETGDTEWYDEEIFKEAGDE